MMNNTIITVGDSVGGSFLAGDIVSTNPKGNFLVTSFDSSTATMTVKKWVWWMAVIRWNPCNNLLELI